MKKLLLSVSFAVITLSAFAQKTISDANAEKRNVSGYHGISVSGGVDLYLSQGSESVAVSASETKFRDRIKTEVKDGILKIWYEHTTGFDINTGHRKLKAYVSFKDLDKLIASGGSDVDVDGAIKVNDLYMDLSGGSDFRGKVDVSELKTQASGGSDLYINGVVKTLTIDASGGSDFKGYDLEADVCSLQASGGSDVQITVNKELNASASGGSDVYYRGNGSVREVKSSGSSSVKKTSR